MRGFLPSRAWICMFVQKTRPCLCKNASAFEGKRACVSGEMHLRLKGNVLAFPKKVARKSVKKDGKLLEKRVKNLYISLKMSKFISIN